jgi:malonyl CoA-acyl carrier protein transacylase
MMKLHHLTAPAISALDNLEEATKLVHSVSPESSFPLPRQRSRWMNLPIRHYLPKAGENHIVGFFPGLGSRASYQNLDGFILDSGIPEVVKIYRDGARALGFPGQPDKLLMVSENMPKGKMEKQGFIGAGLIVHNLALEAYLRAAAKKSGVAMSFMAYTGESFGIITAAVASGSISVSDGVKIAQAFTPLMMLAAEGEDLDDPFTQQIACYLPESVIGKRLVQEPYCVLALKGYPEDLTEILEGIEKNYPKVDVEVHKLYSWRQTNVYVRVGVKPSFDLFMRQFPAVTMEELKLPTTFLAHSERMCVVRRALERFIEEKNIVFKKPRVPVVSNNNAGLLTTAAEVRRGVLAITNEIMASQATVETLNSLHPAMIVEVGLGNKSVQLLTDNNIEAPVMAYTGTTDETDIFLRAVKLVDGLKGELEILHASGERLEARHYDTLRSIFQLTLKNHFCERYFYWTMSRVIANEMLHSARDGSPVFYQFVEVFQHTYKYRTSINIGKGELVLQARLKKKIVGHPEGLGQVYAELKVIDGSGDVADRSLINVKQPEVVVFHFDRLADLCYADLAHKMRLLLDAQPLVRQIYEQMLKSLRMEAEAFLPLTGAIVPTVNQIVISNIVYQYTLFHTLYLYRPAMFVQSDYYLEGSDPVGWLVALAVSGAIPLPDIMAPFGAYLRAGTGTDGVNAALDRMLSSLGNSDIPVISPEGTPLQSKKDLEVATRAVFRDSALDARVRRIHLNGNCQILSLGSAFDPALVDAGPYQADVISVLRPADIWKKRVNPALDDFEDRCILTLTDENEKVLRFAQSRKFVGSTVYAYVNIGEPIVGFGKGGSESMTIFLERARKDGITVRKILSEALTTAHWNPKGEGVMLPPFAKAKKQAEYLQALPESARRNFPEVYNVLERDIPTPAHLQKSGKNTYKEVIYEMSYAPGEEVSRLVEKHSPPPVVIARLYEAIFRLLNQSVHTVNRVPAPAETLDVSYLKKIEHRLALCRHTAPRTFSPELLDTERIIINGVSNLNSSALLKRFRQRPEFLEILEPRFHCLVMGDTNTENIKIADPELLLRAQRLIETGAPQREIDAALAAITPKSLGIKFLDPRAIGFRSNGRYTRDDPMYDNKYWHNSLGHYDEIHYEQFKMHVQTAEEQIPSVDIEFNEGNPYQKAYRVRDVEAKGDKIDKAATPQGMEDYFAPVMTTVYGLDDSESQNLKDDPYWLIRFVFVMGTHFAAMPPFHFQSELDGTLTDTYSAQQRPVAVYCEGIKWLNWALEMLEGERKEFLGVQVPPLPYLVSVSDLSPRRPRTREINPSVGTMYSPQQIGRNPRVSFAKSGQNSNAKVDDQPRGSARLRFSRVPVSSIAATTSSSGNTRASKPIDTS